jgi:cytochrome P450
MQGEIMQFIDEGVKQGATAAEDNFVKRFVQEHPSNEHFSQLRFITRDILAAGTDTTTVTLQWTVLLLANHSGVQTRIREEMTSSNMAAPMLEDQSRMPYTTAVISEVLRLRTVAPLSVFHTTTADTMIRGYFVPQGTVVCNLLGYDERL